MSFFENTRKPQGFGGKLMTKMMNSGHSRLSQWGFSNISVNPDAEVLDVGCGVLFLLITLDVLVYTLHSLWIGHVVPGWTSLMLSVWFVGAVIFIILGMVGEYIGKIYIEGKNRPRYNI